MSVFLEKLYDKIASSVWNNFEDNYDESRFGKKNKKGLKEIIRKKINKRYLSKFHVLSIIESLRNIGNNYKERFDILYNNLADEQSKNLLIDIWAYRVLGHKLVKLPTNTDSNRETLKRIKTLAQTNDKINPNFLHFQLNRFSLNESGKKANLYFTAEGIMIDFYLEQYKYHNNDITIEAKTGDVIIDGGACWGDTAIYFAGKVGNDGKVLSFEFIPGNIDIFKKNVSLNPEYESRIELIEHPIWNVSGKNVYYSNNGPGSKVSNEEFKDYFGKTKTISLDEMVLKKNIQKLNFIKLDIEGAESFALEGAINSIRTFKPNLAIAIYHSMDDFLNIPQWILNLNLGYKLYLGHYTIHSEETVLFATARS